MTYDDFLPYVAPSVNACPTIVALHHIRLAAIDFCRRSLVWRERLDTLVADGFSTSYALPIDDQVEVAKLLDIEVKDGPTSRPQEATLIDSIAGRDIVRHGCTELTAWTDNRRTLNVWPAPRSEAEIDVLVALKPSLTSFSFSDEVFAQHAQDIAGGALSTLYAMPKCDWSDPGMAQVKKLAFDSRISTVAQAATRGNVRRQRSLAERFF